MELSEVEKTVLKLHPKFAVREDIEEDEIDFQDELGYAKLRYQEEIFALCFSFYPYFLKCALTILCLLCYKDMQTNFEDPLQFLGHSLLLWPLLTALL